MWYSLLVVLCLHFDSAIAQPCPSGWTYINATNACYQMTENSFDFNTSWAMCQASGASLMSITNQAEIQWIIATMIPFGVPSGSNFLWVGAVDLTGTGSFQWTDGQPFNTSLWATGEPIAGNNCGYWEWTLPHLPYNGNLFTQPCTFPHWFACKKIPYTKCIPLNGLWSAYSTSSPCNDSCGLCGMETQSRSCYPSGCIGSSTNTTSCANEVCSYPRRVCCLPHAEKLVKGKYVCV